MPSPSAKFNVGQLIHHRLFDYRGVVIDVDPEFQGTEDWYREIARSRPPKDQPWYHVLVDGAQHNTYVAERNLELDDTREPVNHPFVAMFFDAFEKGVYVRKAKLN